MLLNIIQSKKLFSKEIHKMSNVMHNKTSQIEKTKSQNLKQLLNSNAFTTKATKISTIKPSFSTKLPKINVRLPRVPTLKLQPPIQVSQHSNSSRVPNNTPTHIQQPTIFQQHPDSSLIPSNNPFQTQQTSLCKINQNNQCYQVLTSTLQSLITTIII